MLVNYKRSGVMNADGVILKPGVNPVDIKAWAKARKHPMITQLINDGVIEETTELEEVENKDQNEVNESILSPMKIPQARALIEETADLELLKSWKRVEKRNQVISTLNAQIEKLTAPPEQRDADTKRQITSGAEVRETFVQNPGDRE